MYIIIMVIMIIMIIMLHIIQVIALHTSALAEGAEDMDGACACSASKLRCVGIRPPSVFAFPLVLTILY